jgi:hypothetical protein
VPTGGPGPPRAHIPRRDRVGARTYRLIRVEYREHTDDVQDARQIVGESAQRQLGATLGSVFIKN